MTDPTFVEVKRAITPGFSPAFTWRVEWDDGTHVLAGTARSSVLAMRCANRAIEDKGDV